MARRDRPWASWSAPGSCTARQGPPPPLPGVQAPSGGTWAAAVKGDTCASLLSIRLSSGSNSSSRVRRFSTPAGCRCMPRLAAAPPLDAPHTLPLSCGLAEVRPLLKARRA